MSPHTEVELKLRVPAAQYARLAHLPVLQPAEAPVAHRLHAIYYDTADHALWRAGLALRVRRDGSTWIQTLKGAGSADAGLHQRIELEVPMPGPAADPARFPPGPWTDKLLQALGGQPLQRVCTTRFGRSVRLLRPAPDTLIEASLDRGEIASAGRREPLCEIELELKAGPPAALYRLALELVEAVPLAVESRSKAERGYALHSGAADAPVKGSIVALAPDTTVSDAFKFIVRGVLAHLQANERGLQQQSDPEYVHQMRVALRRLRSVFSVFRSVLPPDAVTDFVGEMRWLARTLGPARDWDVFIDTVYRDVRTAFPVHAGLSAYGRAFARRQRAARQRARRAVASTRYQKLILRLGAWWHDEGWRHAAGSDIAQALEQPLLPYATDVLEARYARLRKRGRKFDRRSLEELHALRIAAKKLRYAAQFFAGLYDDGTRAEALLRQLADLQDALGVLNDAAGTPALVQSAAPPGTTRELAEARGMLLAWNLGQVELLRREAGRAWQALRRTASFW